jgi:hypothetical protein
VFYAQAMGQMLQNVQNKIFLKNLNCQIALKV